MRHSRRSVRARRRSQKRFAQERRVCNPAERCVECGGSLGGSPHHFLCTACHVPGKMHSKRIRDKLRGIDLKEWKGDNGA